MKINFLIFSLISMMNQLFANFNIDTNISIGENNYKKYDFSLGISSNDFFTSFLYSQYSSDFLFTRKEFSLSGGYIFEDLKISLNLGMEPYSDGFSSNFIGLDLFYRFIANENSELGSGINFLYKINKDSYIISSSTQTSETGRRKNTLTTKTSEYEINETTKKIYIDFSHKLLYLNISYTDIDYNKTDSNLTPALQRSVSNLFITDGYIKNIISTSLSFDFNILTLKTGYTKSNYLGSSKSVNSIYSSIQKDFDDYSIGLGYERFNDEYYSDKGDVYSMNFSLYF